MIMACEGGNGIFPEETRPGLFIVTLNVEHFVKTIDIKKEEQ